VRSPIACRSTDEPYDVCLVSAHPDLRPLSVEELRALDARYSPIPIFADWPGEPPRVDLWERLCRELAALREIPAAAAALGAAVTTVLRTAAFEAGAIERLYETDRGLTFTVATQAAAWESEVAARSPDALELFEAQLAAYELVLDVATQYRPVTEVWIRELHELLTGPQETHTVVTPVGVQERPLPKGVYKQDPNHVRFADGAVHTYAPVDETPAEMGRLAAELRSEAFAEAHPLLQTSYAHYCLVAIHPFADGNGRVARAVASTHLYRAASIPLLVLSDQRLEYFRALELADARDSEPFVAFVGEEARSAISMIIDALKSAIAPNPENAVSALKRLLVAQGGLTHQELGAIASQLLGILASTINQRVQELGLPPGVSGAGFQGSGPQPTLHRPGFRPIPPQIGGAMAINRAGLTLNSAAPAAASVQASTEVLVSASGDDAETFLLAVDDAPDDDIVFGLRDVYPELTVAATYRLESFVNRLLGTALDELVEKANSSLGHSDYQLANYEARIQRGDLAMSIDRNTVLAYLVTSGEVARLGVLAQEIGFTLTPPDEPSLRTLVLASRQEGIGEIDDLDRFLVSADPWMGTALVTVWNARPTDGWTAPLPFIVATIVWIGGASDSKGIREVGGDNFFVDAVENARRRINDRSS
jgi:Fic family protein